MTERRYRPGDVTITFGGVEPPSPSSVTVGQCGAPANTDRAEGLRRQDRGLCPWHDDPEFGCEPCADIINAKYRE